MHYKDWDMSFVIHNMEEGLKVNLKLPSIVIILIKKGLLSHSKLFTCADLEPKRYFKTFLECLQLKLFICPYHQTGALLNGVMQHSSPTYDLCIDPILEDVVHDPW